MEKSDESVFDGCQGVTVYGAKNTEAERITNMYGFQFVPFNGEPEPPVDPTAQEKPPPADAGGETLTRIIREFQTL